jgi:hypothetical protein
MNRFTRNILLFSREEFMSEQAIEKEVSYLNGILSVADTTEAFCRANELVDRNSITSNPRKILKEARHFRMREFRFLINKN